MALVDALTKAMALVDALAKAMALVDPFESTGPDTGADAFSMIASYMKDMHWPSLIIGALAAYAGVTFIQGVNFFLRWLIRCMCLLSESEAEAEAGEQEHSEAGEQEHPERQSLCEQCGIKGATWQKNVYFCESVISQATKPTHANKHLTFHLEKSCRSVVHDFRTFQLCTKSQCLDKFKKSQ